MAIVPFKRRRAEPEDDAVVVYGATAIKRSRSTRAELEALEAEIYEYVKQQNPITVRGVFYGMTVRGHVTKDDSGYRRVQRRVLEMRRRDDLPYEWISHPAGRDGRTTNQRGVGTAMKRKTSDAAGFPLFCEPLTVKCSSRLDRLRGWPQ